MAGLYFEIDTELYDYFTYVTKKTPKKTECCISEIIRF